MHFFSHTTVLYFLNYLKLGGLLSKLHLRLFRQKDAAVHKLWIPVMESESSLRYLQYLDVRKIVPCLHRVPYRNGLQLQKASVNGTGTRETSKNPTTVMCLGNLDNNWVKNKQLRRRTSLMFWVLLLLSYAETGKT